jgi:hypothetical protein
MSLLKKEKDAAMQQVTVLKEQSLISSKASLQLNAQISESGSRIVALENALTHCQQELKIAHDAVKRMEADHARALLLMKQESHQLKLGFKETINDIERKLHVTQEEALSKVEAAEVKCKREQELARKATAEVEAMKVLSHLVTISKRF